MIVPSEYKANTISSYQDIIDTGYPTEPTGNIINCPVVPEGSTAGQRYNTSESKSTDRGWYKGKVVYYFTFIEKTLTVNLPSSGPAQVPLSGILVTFNINPDMAGGGPPSGFVTETGTVQTHNVLETLPEDGEYSPLWSVNVYDNAAFNNVSDWNSASNANILAEGVMLVNCPVILVQEAK